MNPAYLYWTEAEPTTDNWPDLPTRGVAEWSDAVPALFLLLIGPAPARCEWPVYNDGPQPPALICRWPAAAQRLKALQARLLRPKHERDGAALRQQLQAVAAAFAE